MKKLENMTEPELSELMIAIGNQIKATCAVFEVEKPLFCLVLFSDPKVAQYIGNCERSSMIQAMRETADRLEKNQDVPR